MTSVKKYVVKKGPADPFRGDWYIFDTAFDHETEATSYAFRITLENYNSLHGSWDQYGYEWSVFVGDKKIWEGFKCIQELWRKKEMIADIKDGFLE